MPNLDSHAALEPVSDRPDPEIDLVTPVVLAAGILGLLTALSLTGCTADDAHLRLAPPDDDRLGTASPGGDSGAGAPPAPTGPWANLDPGDMPDTLFAVAWTDLTEGCVDCYYAPNAPDLYSVVDVRGQVLANFELPFSWQSNYYPPPLISWENSGQGRFVAANYLGWPVEDHLVVWEGDAYSEESYVLARVYSDRVELPGGVVRELPDDVPLWGVTVQPDPRRDGALLIVPELESPYIDDVYSVWSVPLSDAEAPVERWAPRDVREILEGGAPDQLLVPDSVIVPADEERGAVVLAPPLSCAGGLTWWEDGQVSEIALAEQDQCPRPGPVLDRASRTFLYSAWVDLASYNSEQRLVVSVAGNEVWSLDTFKRGLSERPLHLFDAVVLER